MKNPFQKNDNRLFIAGIAIGAAAAGLAAYLFLTESGSEIRERLTDKLSNLADQLFGNGDEHANGVQKQAYLQHRRVAPKTDREQLLKHEILNQPHTEHTDEEQHD